MVDQIEVREEGAHMILMKIQVPQIIPLKGEDFLPLNRMTQ